MATPAPWIPTGWKDCPEASCTKRPKSEKDENGINTGKIYCHCDPSCLALRQCGCRMVSRLMKARDPNEPDGWKLGDPVMEETTCGNAIKKLPKLMYRCYCLEKDPNASKPVREVGKYEVYRDRADKFRFRLKASNGEIVLVSQGYKSESSCMRGAISVHINGTDSSRYQRQETRNGKFRFNLRAANNRVIGTSETYESERSMKQGILAVQKASATGRFVNLI